MAFYSNNNFHSLRMKIEQLKHAVRSEMPSVGTRIEQ